MLSNNLDLITPKPKVCAVIAAAGKSSRMNFADGSKQFIEIGGKTVIEKTLTIFNSCVYIDEIIVAARDEDIDKIRKIAKNAGLRKIKDVIAGGETRQESVAKAVDMIGEHIEYIAIHDGARCFISHEDIEKVVLRAFDTFAAAAGTRVTDTIKLADKDNFIVQTLDRNFLWAVQTPQVFLKDVYITSLKHCRANNSFVNMTDDCELVEAAGFRISIVECSKYNIKITDRQDLKFINIKGTYNNAAKI